MKNEKQKTIDKIFTAAKNKNQDALEKVILGTSVFEKNNHTAISKDEWERAHQHYQQKKKVKNIIKFGLIGFGAVIVLLILIFIVMIMLRKPSWEQVLGGGIDWIKQPTATMVPTLEPTPTFTPELTLEPTEVVYDVSEGLIMDFASITPMLPLVNPDKAWLINQQVFIEDQNIPDGIEEETSSEVTGEPTTEPVIEQEPTTISYLGLGETLSIQIKRPMNPGVYQICYLEPATHSVGDYYFSLYADDMSLSPMNNNENKLIFMDDSIQVDDRWACLGYYDIPSTEDFSIQASFKIDQEGDEFPLTKFLIMRLPDEEADMLRDLKINIQEDSMIVAVEDGLDIKSNTGFSSSQLPGYWGSGLTKMDALEPGEYSAVIPDVITVETGSYQLAVHIPGDACKANIAYALVKYEVDKEPIEMQERVSESYLEVTSVNCTDRWVVGGQWTFEAKQSVLVRADITVVESGTTAGFDAVAMIKIR